MLKEAHDVNRPLQTDGHTVADCSDSLKAHILAVVDENGSLISFLWLSTGYKIHFDNGPHFEVHSL